MPIVLLALLLNTATVTTLENRFRRDEPKSVFEECTSFIPPIKNPNFFVMYNEAFLREKGKWDFQFDFLNQTVDLTPVKPTESEYTAVKFDYGQNKITYFCPGSTKARFVQLKKSLSLPYDFPPCNVFSCTTEYGKNKFIQYTSKEFLFSYSVTKYDNGQCQFAGSGLPGQVIYMENDCNRVKTGEPVKKLPPC